MKWLRSNLNKIGIKNLWIIALVASFLCIWQGGFTAWYWWQVVRNHGKYEVADFAFTETKQVKWGRNKGLHYIVAVGRIGGSEEELYPWEEYKDIATARESVWRVRFNNEAAKTVYAGRNFRVIGLNDFASAKRNAILYSLFAILPTPACFMGLKAASASDREGLKQSASNLN